MRDSGICFLGHFPCATQVQLPTTLPQSAQLYHFKAYLILPHDTRSASKITGFCHFFTTFVFLPADFRSASAMIEFCHLFSAIFPPLPRSILVFPLHDHGILSHNFPNFSPAHFLPCHIRSENKITSVRSSSLQNA